MIYIIIFCINNIYTLLIKSKMMINPMESIQTELAGTTAESAPY